MRLLLLISLITLCSCVHEAPYELKSPCVSEEGSGLEYHNPCVRKPINLRIV
jgi:hypothetical protein